MDTLVETGFYYVVIFSKDGQENEYSFHHCLRAATESQQYWQKHVWPGVNVLVRLIRKMDRCIFESE
jgi:hypothetical protein